jgi:hypothetical protein
MSGYVWVLMNDTEYHNDTRPTRRRARELLAREKKAAREAGRQPSYTYIGKCFIEEEVSK